ncbi:Protein FAM107A [Triplophysa tibetana]|uniref:Actin-associated protein FAM107A n=1 Tax=Triplophysa tibetana TaxID=1572043 RepID=A0A5A9NVI1_9TELE|nr:Protein FAM107A [Triplophysa tibetana]
MGVTHGKKKADHNHQNQKPSCAQPLMGPRESDPVSDFGFVTDSDQRWGAEEDFDRRHLLPKQTQSRYYDELIRPKKIPNPVKASKSLRELHRELLITQKRGVMEEKPELQKVLEQRNIIQALKQKKQDVEKSPLKQELLKRQMRLDKLERETEKQNEMLQGAPEFIRVKENLKSTAATSTAEKESQLNISLH